MSKIEALNAQRLQKQLQRALADKARAEDIARRRQLYGPPAKPVPTSPQLIKYFQLIQPGL